MTPVLFRLWIYEQLALLFDGALPSAPARPDAAGSSPQLAAAANAMCAALADTPRDDRSADHARLFVNAVGGVAAPPYASWYLDGRLLGPSVQWVERAYAEQGLERSPDAGEPPDYVGAELEFLHFLARHELAARATGDNDSLRNVLAEERKFVLEHAARWLPSFAAQIRASNPGPVFAAAADVLGLVVRDEVSRLSIRGSNSTATAGHE